MRILRLALVSLVPLAAGNAARAALTTETILFIRHGEKSPNGLGQLSCRGLNRALKLAGVLQSRYGKIDAVFAPDPSQQKPDGALSWDYVRPLATVEPTAVRFGLPVHAAIGYGEADKLLAAVQAQEFAESTVLVAWEHHQLDALVPALLRSLGGSAAAVRKWPREDFDSIWKVTIAKDGGRTTATFTHEREGLDGQPETCPE